MYFEQKIHNLQAGLHDAFFRIGSDLRYAMARLLSFEHHNHEALPSNRGQPSPLVPGDSSPAKEQQLVNDIECNHDVNIPQLDGAHAALPEPPSDTVTRTSNFVFNKVKQIEKIKRDADISDYLVNVNNNNQNATIKCSTGFYMQVARASLGALKEDSILSSGDIVIKVDKITISKDQLGTEATKTDSIFLFEWSKKHWWSCSSSPPF